MSDLLTNMTEKLAEKNAEIERLRKEVAYNRKDMHALRDECRRLEGHNAKLQAVVDAARPIADNYTTGFAGHIELIQALAALEGGDE
jgi:predicted nuclease with TOPRIM domain